MAKEINPEESAADSSWVFPDDDAMPPQISSELTTELPASIDDFAGPLAELLSSSPASPPIDSQPMPPDDADLDGSVVFGVEARHPRSRPGRPVAPADEGRSAAEHVPIDRPAIGPPRRQPADPLPPIDDVFGPTVDAFLPPEPVEAPPAIDPVDLFDPVGPGDPLDDAFGPPHHGFEPAGHDVLDDVTSSRPADLSDGLVFSTEAAQPDELQWSTVVGEPADPLDPHPPRGLYLEETVRPGNRQMGAIRSPGEPRSGAVLRGLTELTDRRSFWTVTAGSALIAVLLIGLAFLRLIGDPPVAAGTGAVSGDGTGQIEASGNEPSAASPSAVDQATATPSSADASTSAPGSTSASTRAGSTSSRPRPTSAVAGNTPTTADKPTTTEDPTTTSIDETTTTSDGGTTTTEDTTTSSTEDTTTTTDGGTTTTEDTTTTTDGGTTTTTDGGTTTTSDGGTTTTEDTSSTTTEGGTATTAGGATTTEAPTTTAAG